ncbi:MAG TPA: hemerythrin domain-containing protein, partial [Acidimicrobiales bacterium]|nr:hemerythrin domain-containing protein [Acidimicrobiales bacterium]
MAEPGSYQTETGDMRVVHEALLAAFDAADALVAGAGSDVANVATVATFFENILEFLHVHHEGEDDLLYP